MSDTAAKSDAAGVKTDGESAAPKLEGQALLDALANQLEFYFSKDNLAQDAYLVSQMNAEKYVNVDVIAGFKRVQGLTEDR